MEFSHINYSYYVHICFLNRRHIPRTQSEISVREYDHGLELDVEGIQQAARGMPFDLLIDRVDETVAWLQGQSEKGNPFSDDAHKIGTENWSGWFFDTDTNTI